MPDNQTKAKRGAFLDRDGVLCRSRIIDGKAYAVRRLEEFRLLPGAVQAVAALRQSGYAIVVVTNQPDIGNGWVEIEVVEAMHRRLRERLAPDAIEMCPHRQGDGCECRKPRPGMLRSAAARLGIDLGRSVMVGDRWSDIVAGAEVGCYTVFIDRGYSEFLPVRPDCTVRSLRTAVDCIVARAVSPDS
jgi:D-glycero-D-manno-heptose 1,7-bisphosphate phosphatase